MAEPHVTHVHGQECDGWLRLRWHGPNGEDHFALPLEIVAALRIHLARPEVPTPLAWATEIVEDWVMTQQPFSISTDSRTNVRCAMSNMADLVDRLAGTIAAERERER